MNAGPFDRLRSLTSRAASVARAVPARIAHKVGSEAKDVAGDFRSDVRALRQSGAGLKRRAMAVVRYERRKIFESVARKEGLYVTPARQTPQQAARERQRVMTRVNAMPADKRAVLQSVQKTGANVVELMHGAHVVIDDGGKRYNEWKAMATPRSSSHYKDVNSQQYEINMNGSPLLFGKDAQGRTWMQMEHASGAGWGKAPNLGKVIRGKAPLVDPALAQHITDFVTYKATGENVGPMGLSTHSELHDPLIYKDPETQ